MKIYIFILLIPSLLCFLNKKSLNLNQDNEQELTSQSNLQISNFMKGYGKQILQQLNDYRQQHFFLEHIEWNDQLFKQTHKEALDIINTNSFGKHQKYQEWEKATKNEYLTEIAMQIEISEVEKQSALKFSTFVVGTVMKKYKNYLSKYYDSIGIAVVPSNEPKQYIVFFQLVSNKHKYSCKKALEEGKRPKQVSVTNRGKTETLKCDMTTEGGGWTLIADVNNYAKAKALIIPIDDKGLEYSQILFEAKPNWYLNYNYGSVNNWDFNGYNFRFNCLRFGDKWFVDASHDGYRVNYFVYNRAQDLVILKPATKCFFGGSQQLYNCAQKFIFKSVPNTGRLNAFSELQSAANTDLHNNIYRFSFKLYVK